MGTSGYENTALTEGQSEADTESLIENESADGRYKIVYRIKY